MISNHIVYLDRPRYQRTRDIHVIHYMNKIVIRVVRSQCMINI